MKIILPRFSTHYYSKIVGAGQNPFPSNLTISHQNNLEIKNNYQPKNSK